MGNAPRSPNGATSASTCRWRSWTRDGSFTPPATSAACSSEWSSSCPSAASANNCRSSVESVTGSRGPLACAIRGRRQRSHGWGVDVAKGRRDGSSSQPRDRGKSDGQWCSTQVGAVCIHRLGQPFVHPVMMIARVAGFDAAQSAKCGLHATSIRCKKTTCRQAPQRIQVITDLPVALQRMCRVRRCVVGVSGGRSAAAVRQTALSALAPRGRTTIIPQRDTHNDPSKEYERWPLPRFRHADSAATTWRPFSTAWSRGSSRLTPRAG